MAYEEISDVEVVKLEAGGNDTIEGYLVAKEQRPNKFNPGTPQNFYIFETQNGIKGVYAKAGINSALKNAVIGRMTKLWATGEELDTGKGFPMKVFKAAQDKNNVRDESQISYVSPSAQSDESDDYDSVPAPTTKVAAAPAKAPLAAVAQASKQAEIQALLRNRK